MTIASSDAQPITVTPYLCVKGAASALDFYTRAFGAVETLRLPAPEGRIGHAEIRIGGPGGAPIFLADEFPEIGVLSPETLGGSPVTIPPTVPHADTLFARAGAPGALALRPVAAQGHRHRNRQLTDPLGPTRMPS